MIIKLSEIIALKLITYFEEAILRLDGNMESKSSKNTYLNIIDIFNKLFKKLNIIESQNLVVTSTKIFNIFFEYFDDVKYAKHP